MSVSAADVLQNDVEDSPVGSVAPQSGPNIEQNRPFSLTVDVGRVVKTLFIIIAIQFVTASAANLVTDYVAPSKKHKLAKRMQRFIAEMSIPNWYS